MPRQWIAAMAGIFALGFAGQVVASPPPCDDSLYTSDKQFEGVASCAAAQCHSRNEGGASPKLAEYSIWVRTDKHSKAYSVLSDPKSRRMVELLKDPRAPDPMKPEKNTLCLDCHVQPNALKASNGPRFDLADGVACENCHGPAQEWRTLHTQEGWKGKSTEEKRKFGMWDTKDLVSRAQLCVRCHIGTKDSSVDHNLIAAGHPRLGFEFKAFLDGMPKHWDEEGINKQPDFPARAWYIGQIISARAAVEVLTGWTSRPAKNSLDFAAYDCYACHHDLRQPSWRQDQKDYYEGRVPGTLPFGNWYFATCRELVRTWPSKNATLLEQSLANLPEPFASRQGNVNDAARKLSDNLCLWLQEHPNAPTDWGRLLKAFNDEPVKNWDDAFQRTVAVSALRQSFPDNTPQAQELEAWLKSHPRESLNFPKGYTSPYGFSPKLYNSGTK
jgi:hypothetical protein